jgi:hypothetical protein
MMTRLDSEWLGKEFAARRIDVQHLAEFLEEVADYAKKNGFDLNAHPNGNCRQCGRAIERDSNAAIYCSRECRQLAYRERKAQARGRNSPLPKRLRLKRPLHAKKCSVSGLDDAFSSAEDKQP